MGNVGIDEWVDDIKAQAKSSQLTTEQYTDFILP